MNPPDGLISQLRTPEEMAKHQYPRTSTGYYPGCRTGVLLTNKRPCTAAPQNSPSNRRNAHESSADWNYWTRWDPCSQ